MEDYEDEELNYDTRTDKIIEYIHNNDCRSKEQVIQAVSKHMARDTAIKKLNLLEADGIIATYKESYNARDKRIILDKNHIFSEVFNELNIVERIFEELSVKIIEKIDSLEKQYRDDEFSVDYQTKYTEISSLSYELYFKIVNEYLTRCLLVWPYKINNPDILKILNGLVFTKLNDIQNKIQQSAIMLNMSKNVYNYHNRERISFSVIETINNINLSDFEKDKDGKYIKLLMQACSLNEDNENDIDEDYDYNLDNVDTSRLSEETKQIVDSMKLEKLYKKYPYENFDIEEYQNVDNTNNKNNNIDTDKEKKLK